jgi:hypothetical protein
MSQDCGHQRAYCSSPGRYVSLEGHGDDDDASWGITLDSAIRALCQCYQQIHLGQVGGMDEGAKILPIQYLRYLKGSLTCRKMLTWDLRLYFPSEGRCAADFYPSHRPGLNPLPLDPVARTLTTTPPRRRSSAYVITFPSIATGTPTMYGQYMSTRR